MAILTVNRTFEQEEMFRDETDVAFRELYIVTSDSMTENSTTVETADGIPLLGSSHDSIPLALCQTKIVTHRDDKPFVYDVQVEYSTAVQTALFRQPSVSYGAAKTREGFDYDIDDRAVANSAGQAFDPGLTRDVTRPTITITRNELSGSQAFSLARIVQYYDTVNELDWPEAQGFDFVLPGQAKMASITANKIFEPNGSVYWSVTYEIHLRRNGWDKLLIVDSGVQELEFDSDGNVIGWKNYMVGDDIGTEPRLLDGFGSFIPYGQAIVPGTPGNPGNPGELAWMEYRPYLVVDWTPLNLEAALMGLATPFAN